LSSRRGARCLLLCWRQHQSDPGIPARRPVFAVELLVAFKIEVALRIGAHRKNEAELRSDAEHARPEGTDLIGGAAVAPLLVIDIADHAHLHVLAEKLRGAPIEMQVGAVAV
jgi:hypothetical protein